MEKNEKEITVAQIQGLETTLTGKLNGKTRKIRVVVLRKASCVYDLMYLALPEQFKLKEEEFNRFVASLKLQ